MSEDLVARDFNIPCNIGVYGSLVGNVNGKFIGIEKFTHAKLDVYGDERSAYLTIRRSENPDDYVNLAIYKINQNIFQAISNFENYPWLYHLERWIPNEKRKKLKEFMVFIMNEQACYTNRKYGLKANTDYMKKVYAGYKEINLDTKPLDKILDLYDERQKRYIKTGELPPAKPVELDDEEKHLVKLLERMARLK